MDSMLQKLKNTIHYQSGGVLGSDNNGPPSLSENASASNRSSYEGTSTTYGDADMDSGDRNVKKMCLILARFLVMKISWRGLYRRIMAVRMDSKGDSKIHYIETYHPETGALTNSWNCNDVVDIKPAGEHPQEGGVFVITLRHQHSTKEVKFASQERSGLLESLYTALRDANSARFYSQIVSIPNGGVFPAYRFIASKENGYFKKNLETFLRVSATGIEEIFRDDSERSVSVWKFMYASKPGVRFLGGEAPRDGFESISLFSNTSISPKIYAVRDRNLFCDALCSCGRELMGIHVEVDKSTSHLSPAEMLHGLMSAEKAKDSENNMLPLGEWEFTKVIDTDEINSPRILVITEHSFIERVSDSYGVSECRPLSAIASVIRYVNDEQLVGIEWGDGSRRDIFRSSEGVIFRDAFLTSLLYAAQRAAKRPIEVLPCPLRAGDPLIRMHYHPVGTPTIFYDAVTESIAIKQLQNASIPFLIHAKDSSLSSLVHGDMESARLMQQRLYEFNATIPYSGVSKDTIVDNRVVDAILMFLPCLSPGYRKLGTISLDQEKVVIMALASLQRILCSIAAKSYYFGLSDSFRKIYICLECDNDHVAVEAARLLLRFFLGTTNSEVLSRPSWEKDILKTTDPMEYHQMALSSRMAKSICFLSDTRCSTVIDTLRNRRIVSPLLGTVIMEILVSVSCFPMAETTDMATRETMIQEVSSLGRKLFSLFQDPRLPVYNGLALVMRTLAEGGIKAAEPMRRAALEQGALLTHLRCSLRIDSSSSDKESSRELVSLWCDGYVPAMDLLKRIFPPGITAVLERRKSKWNKRNTRNSIIGQSSKEGTNEDGGTKSERDNFSSLNIRHQESSVYSFLQGNWSAFWERIDQDSHHAGLIWNETCRSELRQALKGEDKLLQIGKQKLLESDEMSPSWNFGDFRVEYDTLKSFIQVGDMYIQLMVNSGDSVALECIRDPKDFISSTYMYFLKAADSSIMDTPVSAIDKQCLCLRAMSMVYSQFCTEIGKFIEVENIIKICDLSKHRKLRYYAMDLLHSLVNPERSVDEDLARKVAKENAVQVAQHGGIHLLCDAVATIHELENFYGQTFKDTKLIAGKNMQVEPKIWYHMESHGADSNEDLMATFEKAKKGPYGKKELRRLYRNGLISEFSYMYRIGMRLPVVMTSIRELRWWCDKGTSPYPERDFAMKALISLTRILELCPAKDSTSGVQLLPLPLCHRSLSQKQCISRIAQSILTNDPDFVNTSFKLLTIFVEQNVEALRTIYETGVFYYALAYSGADLLEPAKFLKATHLQQKFHRQDAPFIDTLAKRSILGDFLPESLLFILESYGPEAFSSAITGDSESPEIIWTHAMRCQKLIPHLWNHIGGFTTLLKESWALTYDYYPCPPLMYEEIDGEIWCHRYYLKHLCNTAKYPDWKIVDHLEFLQSVLGSWKKELAKVGTVGMSVSDAAKVLELDHDKDISESDMKKSYRRLARKYHPDRNPLGREKFEAIHEAYLRLHSHKEEVSGPREWCILLYIQSQCLIYRRCSNELNQYKYAGYPQILASLSLAGDKDGYAQILSERFIPLLSSSMELCWITCKASALNAEELVRSDGIERLEDIFSRCLSVASADITPSDPIAIIMENILNTFDVIARFETPKDTLGDRTRLLRDALKCCKLKKAWNVVLAAMDFLKKMSSLQKAKQSLISFKIVVDLIPLLFGYDCRLADDLQNQQEEEKSKLEFLGEPDVSSHVQREMHKASLLSCQILAILVAFDESVPNLSMALQALFTPAIARFLHETNTFLRYLNTFSESHLIIWNESMKIFLLEQVERLSGVDCNQYLEIASKTRYKNLIGVTFVDGVYLDHFCNTPSQEGLDDVEFCKHLVKTLHLLQHTKDLDGHKIPNVANDILKPGDIIECMPDECPQEMISRNISRCLDALEKILVLSPKLRGLLSTVASLEPLSAILLQVCIGLDSDPIIHSKIRGKQGYIFLIDDDLASAGNKCLSVLQNLSSNAKCLAAIASQNIPLWLSWIIHQPHSITMLRFSCSCILNLAEQNEFSLFCCESGGIFYLLNFIIAPSNQDINECEIEEITELQQICLEALIKACSNSLHGTKCMRMLKQILPRGILNRLMTDDAKSSFEMLHSSTKNPEIVWNKDMMNQLGEELSVICKDARRAQIDSLLISPKNLTVQWNPGEKFCLQYACLDAHEEVGGIYIDLLLENPGFSVRNPQGLFDSVMQAFIQSPSRNPGDYVSIMKLLLLNHSALSDHGVTSGYLARLFAIMQDVSREGRDEAGKSSLFLDCLKVVHALSSSKTSSDAMAKIRPSIFEVLIADLHGDHQRTIIILEIIKNGLSGSQTARDSLIKSALDFELLPNLLEILDWRKSEKKLEPRDTTSMLRYRCVEIINLMLEEGPHKGRVTAILNGNEVWDAYHNQKHDMFLPSGAQQSETLLSLVEGPSNQRYMLLSGENVDAEEENVISDDLIEAALKAADDQEDVVNCD